MRDPHSIGRRHQADILPTDGWCWTRSSKRHRPFLQSPGFKGRSERIQSLAGGNEVLFFRGRFDCSTVSLDRLAELGQRGRKRVGDDPGRLTRV